MCWSRPPLAKGGMEMKSRLPLLLAALGAVAASAVFLPSVVVAESYKDLNAIIRSLAPIDYLPEHSDDKRRAIDLDIRFKVNSARLTPAAVRQLDELGAALMTVKLQSIRFRIAGHTDASGEADYNKTLSERRAAAVKVYLVEAHAIDPSRLETAGWGEERLKEPLAPGSAVNRRVEIIALDPLPTSQAPEAPREKDIRW